MFHLYRLANSIFLLALIGTLQRTSHFDISMRRKKHLIFLQFVKVLC